MNYPIWELPSSGLLIAAVAILHVFISHFAIGGGLFLLLLEWKAYREADEQLRQYVRNHSRFFVLVTLVLGVVTGVGIWFTIGLVHPQATSFLIQTFVWVWAVEWVFFFVEIAAALIYYYGWDRLSGKTHLTIAAVYFFSAWMSLFVINGILTFMLTPGEWRISGSLWDAFFNPTYWPSLLTRSLICIGLAGLYALFTISRVEDASLKARVSRYASIRWILPAAFLVPFALVWYLAAAASAGVPVAEVLGAKGSHFMGLVEAMLTRPLSIGYPFAQEAAFLAIVATGLIFFSTLVIAVWKPSALRPSSSVPILLLGLVAFGSLEWVREDLRKPYVIGQTLFVNGVSLPVPETAGEERTPLWNDHFSIVELRTKGVLNQAQWIRQATAESQDSDPVGEEELQVEQGREVFGLLCSSCHTVDGHLSITALVKNQNSEAIETILSQLALPEDSSGKTVAWSAADLRLATWRGRRMPPFAGTSDELTALSQFLSSLAEPEEASSVSVGRGQELFEQKCVFCHGPGASWPMTRLARGQEAEQLFEKIGRLPSVNPIMPPFEGSEEDRRFLAEYLSNLGRTPQEPEVN